MEINLRDEELINWIYSNKIFNILLYFFLYSFCGWVFETIYCSIYHGHFVKRGFLIGPICGIYGIGALLVIYVLGYIKAHPFLLFLCSSLLTSILELIVGVLLKTLLNQRLWNYSDNFANFMGFICLRNTIIWSILALFTVYKIHPFIINHITSIPTRTKKLICYTIFLAICFDLSISIYTSVNGISNFTWLSQVFLMKLDKIENVTSRVVYYISH